MTNERAVELLRRLQDEQFDGIHGDERRKALEMAVRALEGDGDTISRQQAIDRMRKLQRWNVVRGYNKNEGFLYDDVMYLLEKLPSAQQEIIRCKDCEYYKIYTLYGQTQGFCNRLGLQAMEIDDFCSRAERRNDETD